MSFEWNPDGQLGNRSNVNFNAPINVKLINAGEVVFLVALDVRFTFIFFQDNSVKCFGLNAYGQLGNG